MQKARQRSTIRTVAMTALVVLFIGSCSNLVLESEKVDERFVQTDKANLSLGLAPGDTLSSITQNITVPDSVEEGTTISWTSSDPDTVAVTGTVTRPAFDAGSRTVTLTATLVTGTASATKTFPLVIIPVEPTDAEAVTSAVAALAIGYATDDSAAGIRQNLTLPATGLWGTTVSWSRTAGTAIDPTNGTVTRSAYLAGNTSVSLRATVTKNAASGTKDFNDLVVIRLPGTDAECVAEDKNFLAIGYAAGDNAASVTQAVTLATTGSNETTISWSSNNSAIASNGAVTRPAYSTGDATVTLTATITKAGSTETKTFTLTVPHFNQADTEAVADGKATLAITYGGSDTASSVTVNIASLPAISSSGTTVSWTTNDAAHMTATGVVTRPAYVNGSSPATVTLTATITKGSVSDTKTFTLTVLEQADPNIAAVAAGKASLVITYGGSDTAASVTLNLAGLPATSSSGTTVSWATNDAAHLTTTGVVTRPTFASGDATVTLTATITKGSVTDTKTFTLTVKAAGTSSITVTLPVAPAATDLVFRNAGNTTITSFTVVRGTPVMVNTAFAGTSYAWYVSNGTTAVSTTSTCTINGNSYSLGSHTLLLDVFAGEKYYSGRIDFIVTLP